MWLQKSNPLLLYCNILSHQLYCCKLTCTNLKCKLQHDTLACGACMVVTASPYLHYEYISSANMSKAAMPE